MEVHSTTPIMNNRNPDEIEEARHVILRAMNESSKNIYTITGTQYPRLRKTCKNGNWSYLAQDLEVDITLWELKCIAQRPDKRWLSRFITIVRDENFAEFLHMSLKWDEEHCISNVERQGESEIEKTRQYIATFMTGKGFDFLVDGITAGVALRELKKVAVFGDPAWEEKLMEIVHDEEFAAILLGDLRDTYIRRRRAFKKAENAVFMRAQEHVATLLRESPSHGDYNIEEIATVMIIETSIRSLKLLVLSSFLKYGYNVAMNEAIQAIEDMVFDAAAARTVYWAIFDSLIDSGELFRQKLDPDEPDLIDLDPDLIDLDEETIPDSPRKRVLHEMPLRNLSPNKRQSTRSMKKKLSGEMYDNLIPRQGFKFSDA